MDTGYSSCGLGTRQLLVLSLCRTKFVDLQQQGNVEIAFPAIDEVNVHPSVVVEIQKGTAGASRLGQ